MTYEQYPIIYQCKICEKNFEEIDVKIFYTENIVSMIDHFTKFHRIVLSPMVWQKK